MRSMNRVFLIGHVGQPPRVRTTPTGRKVANFTLATNEVWRDAGGQRQQRTEWHRIVAFGDLADFAEKYIQKGRFILVEGRLQTRQYTDGQGIARYVTEIVARDIGFLDPRGAAPEVEEPIEPPPAFDEPYEAPSSTPSGDEDLDFLI
ncbi:Single-stranded DNA-binding protein [bacterium HR11]|nr:Single-stranded DNA-binding protein [bacterium HR11]